MAQTVSSCWQPSSDAIKEQKRSYKQPKQIILYRIAAQTAQKGRDSVTWPRFAWTYHRFVFIRSSLTCVFCFASVLLSCDYATCWYGLRSARNRECFADLRVTFLRGSFFCRECVCFLCFIFLQKTPISLKLDLLYAYRFTQCSRHRTTGREMQFCWRKFFYLT